MNEIDFKTFKRLARKGNLVAVMRSFPADLETPVSAFIKLKSHGARFLLESVEMGESLGRYSFIGLDALRTFKIVQDFILVEEAGRPRVVPLEGRNPLEVLRTLLAPFSLRIPERSLPGLVGGAIGYLGYDFVRFLERLPASLKDPLGLPIGNFFLTGSLVIFDHVKRKMLLVSVGRDNAEERLEEIREFLRSPLPSDWTAPRPARRRAEFVSNYREEEFAQAVGKAKEYIRQGDLFQVVLSQRAQGEIQVEPFQVLAKTSVGPE